MTHRFHASTHTQAKQVWQPLLRKSRTTGVLAAIILMLCIVGHDDAYAALQEVRVIAQGQGTTREEAKANALLFAKQAAFIRTARKLDPEKAPAYLNTLDINTITPFIRGVTIVKEQRIDKLYIAETLVTVIDTPIRRAYGMISSDSGTSKTPPVKDTRALVILPVFYNGVEPVVWDEKTNPSYALWKTNALNLTKGALIIPAGDITDRSIVDRDNVLRATFETFKPMLERYGADEMVVAVLIDTFAHDKAQTVEMLLRRIRSGGQKIERFTLNPKSDTTPRETIYAQAVTEAANRMNKAAQATAYKDKKQRESASKQPFVATFATLKEWADIQQALRSEAQIVSVVSQNIQLLKASGTLYINGDKAALLSHFAKGPIVITQTDAKSPWNIRIVK